MMGNDDGAAGNKKVVAKIVKKKKEDGKYNFVQLRNTCIYVSPVYR